jgi:hypothetical protein
VIAAEQERNAELRRRAEALAAEYSAPLPDGDAGLIEANRRMRELIPRAREFYAQFQIDAGVEKEVINGITDPVWQGMMRFIEETPPTGLAGASVKLRLMLDGDLGILDGIEDCGGARAADCLRQVADVIERAA